MKNLYNALLLKQLYQLKNLGYRYTATKPYRSTQEEPLSLPSNLIQLKKQVQNCHLCPLSKSRERVVFGKGSDDAKLMFIGDYPMAQEEQAEEPFVGRGGEMLTRMIEQVIGIPRSAVYLSNLLKCHPKQGGAIEPTLLHTCKAYLLQEIAIVQPRLIIALGETPYHYLTNEKKPIEEIRGELISLEGYQLIVTHHPNFLLKNPSRKKEVFEDLKKIKLLLKQF